MATLNLNKKKFLSEENVAQIVKIGINFGERLNSIESKCIASYDETHSYLKDELCVYDNYIYKCNSTATGTWNPDRWTLIGDDITELTLDEIKAMLGLTQEQLTTLSSIILDSEVRLDKTYSSSKIYTDIQNAIDTAKAYTLAEIGKASGASYKIASSTSDMTDEKVIYLLQNDSTYDMYIVDGGTPVKIGDTNIDLSDYYKKAEIDADFLKIADANNKFATIETVDKKVDKTSIVTTLDENATDEQVPSAKIVYDNIPKDNYIKKLATTDLTELQFKAFSDGWQQRIMQEKIGGTRYLIIDSFKDNEILRYVLRQNTESKEQSMSMLYSDDGGTTFKNANNVCTTKVADVPKTVITFSNKTNYKIFDDAFSYYYVQNGICYLSIYLQCVSPVNTNIGIECTSDIPKPKTQIRKIVTPWELTNYNVAPIFFCLENTKQSAFIIKGGNVGTKYLLQFSYPVAES